jgi:tetratricopeptide (TPR) repeat protein
MSRYHWRIKTKIAMNLPDLKNKARSLIEDESYQEAFDMIIQARQIAPEDLAVLELLEFWYEANDMLSAADKLRGSLETIEQMLIVDPSGDPDKFEHADYYPDVHAVRRDTMGKLTLETLDLQLLKLTLEAYDEHFEKDDIEENEIQNRDSIFNIIVSRVDKDHVEQVFGPLKMMKDKFAQQMISVNPAFGFEKLADSALAGKDFYSAMEHYKRVLSLRPDYFIIALKIAECRIQLKQFDEALIDCDSIPATYKYAHEKGYIIAQALAGLGRFDQAVEQLRIFGIEKMDVGVKVRALTDVQFKEMREREDFKKIMFSPT